MTHVKLVSFTAKGAATLHRVAAALPDVHMECYARTVDPSLADTALTRFAQQAMVDCDLLVFIGAAGIAVRAVAPYLQGKAFDPAVLVIDEAGRFVIPLLSGHLGGANAFAERIATALGATAVITTATDGRGAFAADTWAKDHGCTVMDPANIRHVSGAILRGETVGLRSDFPVVGRLPARVSLDCAADCGIAIGCDTGAAPYRHTLHLVPRIIHLGIGCRKGVLAETIDAAIQALLARHALPWEVLAAVASIDRKRNEPGLLLFCERHALPFRTFPAEALQAVPGDFTPSAFVQKTVSVDNVCERAAVLSAGDGCQLLCRKTVQNGVTAALAEEDWRVMF